MDLKPEIPELGTIFQNLMIINQDKVNGKSISTRSK